MRHGETLWNREGRLLGWTDLPLTAEGEAQARRLKGALPSLPAFSSDLLRARQTAELAGFSPRLYPELREIHFGALEGALWETLDPRYAAARLWVDGVIFPHETRKWLIKALEACALNPEREPFRIGVFQV